MIDYVFKLTNKGVAMNRHFYKYTKLRPEFFNEYLLRATPFSELNDPFEGLIDYIQVKNSIDNIDEYYRSNGQQVDDDPNRYQYLLEGLQVDFDSVGVLSFTEDHTNPLMWAHYSDEHKGMVIEFDANEPLFQDSIDFNDGRKSRFGESILGSTYEFPIKVMYRREKQRYDRLEHVAPNSTREYPWKKILYNVFYTKSNDWIYEKELRSIVELNYADVIICDENEHVWKTCEADSSIKVEKPISGRIKITFPNEYEMHEEMGDESIKNEVFLSLLGLKPLHFFRVNPKAISRVYFGCKCDYEETLDIIKRNSELEHLLNNIYVMEVDDYQYQLKEKKLNVNK